MATVFSDGNAAVQRIVFVTGLCFAILLVQPTAQAQAKNNCLSQLTPGTNYIKSFSLDSKGVPLTKMEYSYVFTRQTTYVIHICFDPAVYPKPPELVIYDSNRNVVATNAIEGQVLSAISYKCASTGIFYLRYLTRNAAPFYGESILSFSINAN